MRVACPARLARTAVMGLAAILPLGPAARAEQLPLWEAGAGIAAISFPEYRGSDERRAYILPVPYLVYRGDFIQVDREKIRGLFFRSDRAEVDVSVNGTVPLKSEDNQARRGLPDLDPTLEIGPSLNFFLHRSADQKFKDEKFKLDLRLPLRAVIATDFRRVHHEGWIFQPNLNLDVHDVLGSGGWNLGLLLGPLFADRRYHQYIYGVEPTFATPARPAYNARGGYAGSQFIAAISKRYPRFWVGGFLKYDNLNGAVFADSPLVKSKQYFSAGFAVTYVFAHSEKTIDANN